MLERCYGLREGARILGISRLTLKKRLLRDLGLALPTLKHGEKLMIRGSDLERLANLRGCQVNWDAVRRSKGMIRVVVHRPEIAQVPQTEAERKSA